MLQFYSASTNIVNSKRAIASCLKISLNDQPNLDCDLIIIYSAMGHDFIELVSEAHKLSPNAQIAGCTGAGVIGKEGPDDSMKALAIMVIKGPKNEFAITGAESIVDKDPYEVTSRLAKELKKKNTGINMIHFLPSGVDMWPAEKAIKGVESVFGPEVPVFGSSATDNMKGISCFNFLDSEVIERGAIMIGFADPTLKILSQASHGTNVLEGMPLVVTKAVSNRIFELNGQPAWKFVTKTLDIPETTHFMDVLMLSLFAVEIPEKYQKDHGPKYFILPIMGSNPDNSIMFPTIISTGTKLYHTRRDEKLMFEGVDQMAQRISARMKSKKIVAVFHADCYFRGRYSFNRILKDEIINRMQSPICGNRKIPWLGLYSGGEWAMIGGKNRLNTFTTTISVLYRNNNLYKNTAQNE